MSKYCWPRLVKIVTMMVKIVKIIWIPCVRNARENDKLRRYAPMAPRTRYALEEVQIGDAECGSGCARWMRIWVRL